MSANDPKRTYQSRPCPSFLYRIAVLYICAPAAVGGNLALALAQERLAEHAKDLGLVLQHYFADCKTGWLAEQHLRQSIERNIPQLKRDPRPLRGCSHHRGMTVVDRP